MRHRVTFQRATKTPDGAGGSTLAWSTVETVWADVKPVSGNERYNSMRVEADVSHTVLTRYRSDIFPSDRMVFDSRQMQVKSVINVEERNRYLEIKAVEYVQTIQLPIFVPLGSDSLIDANGDTFRVQE